MEEKEKQAEEIIKKVFPNFTPQNTITREITKYSSVVVDNAEQKLLLMESYKKYVQDCVKYRQTTHKIPRVSSQDLLAAIHDYYSFQLTDAQKQDFERKLKNGEIEILKNVYTDDGYLDKKREILPHATKKVEPAKKVEIKQGKQQPTPAPQKSPQTRKQEKVEYDEYGVRILPKEEVKRVQEQDYERSM